MSASLRIENLRKSFGGIVVTNDLTLNVPRGSLTAVIGPNGAGKTTLFNLVTGHLRPDSGAIYLDEAEITGRSPISIVKAGVGRAFQVASLFPSFTGRDALAASAAAGAGKLTNCWSRFPDDEARNRADELVQLVGLGHCADRPCGLLSHGDQKMLDIAIALSLSPKLLLLDEPMAGMGREERHAMTDCMRRLRLQHDVTLLFIEHDMDVVFSLAESVCVLQQGAKVAEGPPSVVRSDANVIKAYLGSDFE